MDETIKILLKLVDSINQKLEKLENYKLEEIIMLEDISQKLDKLENNKVEKYETIKEENESLKKKLEQLSQEQDSNIREKIRVGRPVKYKEDIVREIKKLKFEGKSYKEISSILGCSVGYISSKLKC